MGVIVNISSDIKATVQQVFDDLLLGPEDGGLGKKCRLVYPPRSVPCENCVPDPTGQRSSNRYRSGGPVPFPSSQPCPLCYGAGRKQTEQTEEITVKVEWDPKKFVYPFPKIDLAVPNSVCEIKGYLSDLPKFLKADHLVVNLPMEPFLRQKFKAAGEPGDPSNIIQNRYFACHYTRWNG